jgi:ParB family chromosome partitioning protein
MAREAERLLEGTGWLPEPLRLADVEAQASGRDGEAATLPEFLAEDEDRSPEDEVQRPTVAAE